MEANAPHGNHNGHCHGEEHCHAKNEPPIMRELIADPVQPNRISKEQQHRCWKQTKRGNGYDLQD